MTRTLITVPMKAPERSKTRLADRLSQPERTRLARHLFRNTLSTLSQIAEVDLAIVTASQEAALLARSQGAQVIMDQDQGLNAALDTAAHWAEANGYDRLCILPADLAAPDPQDIAALLASDADVTLCPAADRGTNALLLSPPRAIPFCYGPASADRHRAAACSAGLRVSVRSLSSLTHDIDTEAGLDHAFTPPQLKAVCG